MSRDRSSAGREVVAVALVGAVVVLICVAFALFWSKRQTPPPSVDEPASRARTFDTPPARQQAADLETQPSPDAGLALGSPGCGRPAEEGPQQLSALVGLSASPWNVYVPRDYRPDTPLPLVLVVHDLGMTGELAISSTEFDRLADKQRFIVVAPLDPEVPPWWSTDTTAVRRALDGTLDALCIDPGKVFAVGLGAGGRVVEQLSCEGGVAAIATSAYRSRVNEVCAGEPVPHLHLAPLRDGYNPVEGGAGCSTGNKISLAAKEDLWRKHNQCEGKREVRFESEGGTCFGWTCAAPFVSCHIDGGRRWRHMARRMIDAQECDPPPADFEHRDTIWAFFTRVMQGMQMHADSGDDVGN